MQSLPCFKQLLWETAQNIIGEKPPEDWGQNQEIWGRSPSFSSELLGKYGLGYRLTVGESEYLVDHLVTTSSNTTEY